MNLNKIIDFGWLVSWSKRQIVFKGEEAEDRSAQ